MAMELTVETIHRETIKPSSPTPPSLKIFKLSLLDQFAPAKRVPIILWYPNDSGATVDAFAKAKERSQRLKESLSKTLARFYPFAGRILNSSSIECNDEGVYYIEARVNCHLEDIFNQPDGKLLRKLVPTPSESGEEATGPIVLVKVNFFECGGMAISISVSHKTADVSTGSLFINSLAAMARGSREVVISEPVSLSLLLPPMDIPSVVYKPLFNPEKFPTRRLVFDASKILMLKAEAASAEVPQPSRVQAVTALIWKCAMDAVTSKHSGFRHPSGLNLPVSFRKKVNPPVPENCIGNIIYPCVVQTSDSVPQLQRLVQQLRDAIREFNEKLVKNLQGRYAIPNILESVKACGELSKRENVDFYNCTSWCRSELDEADFGWGKPKWVSTGGYTMPNVFTLMDSSGGKGIEAWVSLSKDEMVFFERNEQLLRFASVNPSITL
ncbi:hypothetical protein PTKIN_Ptkin14bG0114100 [Pterospermum kingtungense]